MKNAFLYTTIQKVAKMSEAMTQRAKLMVIGLKSVSKCLVSTKEPPHKNMEMRR